MEPKLQDNGNQQLHVPNQDLEHFIIIAVFNNMRTLKFKAQLTIGFFPTVNQNYGNSQRTLKHRKNKMDRNLLITTYRRG